MLTIQRFAHQKLNRAEVSTFNYNLLNIVLDCCGEFGKAYQFFKQAAVEYDAAYKEQGMNPSHSLADFDKATDDAWSSFNAQVKASALHPRAEVRAAAEIVKAVFSKTPNPTRKSYEVSFAEMRNLLSRLSDIPENVMADALLSEHLQVFRNAVEAFGAAKSGIINQSADRRFGVLKEARDRCYEAWIALSTVLEAGAFNESIPGAEKAIARINIISDALRSRLNRRADNDEDEGNENVFDSIDEATVNGEDVKEA